MRAWLWILFIVFMVLFYAIRDGNTYYHAFGMVGISIALHFVNVGLSKHYIKKAWPNSFEDNTWEATAGLGIVPRWVSFIGIVSMGLFIAGLLNLILLIIGVIENRML